MVDADTLRWLTGHAECPWNTCRNQPQALALTPSRLIRRYSDSTDSLSEGAGAWLVGEGTVVGTCWLAVIAPWATPLSGIVGWPNQPA